MGPGPSRAGSDQDYVSRNLLRKALKPRWHCARWAQAGWMGAGSVPGTRQVCAGSVPGGPPGVRDGKLCTMQSECGTVT